MFLPSLALMSSPLVHFSAHRKYPDDPKKALEYATALSALSATTSMNPAATALIPTAFNELGEGNSPVSFMKPEGLESIGPPKSKLTASDTSLPTQNSLKPKGNLKNMMALAPVLMGHGGGGTFGAMALKHLSLMNSQRNMQIAQETGRLGKWA